MTQAINSPQICPVRALARTAAPRRRPSALRWLSQALVATFAILAASVALAQPLGTYPDRPVRLVVPYPPGGTSDIVGRVLAQALGTRLKQTFLVENKGGAGGQIGTDAVAKSAPDGYTFLVAASGPISYLPALAVSMPYNMQTSFEPIANIVTVPNLMLVNPASGINSLDDLVAYARANPRKVNFGSAGIGSSGHIAGEMLNLLAGIQMVHVPYRGSGPALVGLMGGETTVMLENLPSALPHVRSGKLRGLAVLSKTRSPSAPEFPTTRELGMPDLVIASSTGLIAPKGTPKDVVAIYARILRDIAADPEMVRQFSGLGADVDYLDGAQYTSYIDEEIKRWTAVGRRANISLK
jgi:tripartite-type tricarboxylate transporter receptor subunit TctC